MILDYQESYWTRMDQRAGYLMVFCGHKHLSNPSCVEADAEGSLQEKRICLLTAMQRLGTLTLGHFGLLWHKLSYGSGTPKT